VVLLATNRTASDAIRLVSKGKEILPNHREVHNVESERDEGEVSLWQESKGKS